ncbi:glycosyltransferase [Longimicrobium sp.]|uniref:glycosyltransferase n=1 Tax=Longimicrobium sp. TaxID=2029185 RepID=UPI002E379BD3|nr:glycosyltransferase [Longimicrobium sp.]HEX6036611.1 glycosyltransferase [Longimicrobium sp.]
MKRLRVLHVGKFYPPHHGGMESHVETLCRELRADVDVEVLVSADDRRTTHETVDGVPVTRIGTVANVASASINPGMARAIRRSRADVVHFHHPNPTGVLSYLASGRRGPLIVTYHSDIIRQRVLGAIFNPVLHRFLRGAHAILASSPDYARSSPVLRRHADRVRIVPFGIRADAFASADPEEVARLRTLYGSRVVLAVGRLVYYKGFDYLIRAMQRVDGRLVILGDGPLRAELDALAARTGVADRVTIAGGVPDVAPYYHAADVFALPAVARSEAFGLVQLEAMAAGLPVVNTRIDSGVPFVSRDGESGITVPPADVQALAGALGHLLDAPEARRRLGGGARERARRDFSLERMVAQTLATYREAAAQNPLTPKPTAE